MLDLNLIDILFPVHTKILENYIYFAHLYYVFLLDIDVQNKHNFVDTPRRRYLLSFNIQRRNESSSSLLT